MRKDGFHLLAMALIFILALALKLFFLTQEPLVYNNDAGYYVQYIGEVLAQGYPDVSDPPLAFYFGGVFASFLGVMLGYKVAICIASAAIVFPAYKITEHVCKRRDVALLAAFFVAFSPTSMFMADLFKNMMGLFFGMWFIYFLIKATDRFRMRDALLAIISLALMVGSHFSSSGYVVFTSAPFLVLLPAYEYWKRGKLGRESLFCIAMVGVLLVAGAAAITYKGMGVSGGRIGTVGLYGGDGITLNLVGEYLLFVPFVLLGLRKLKARRLMLFVPWLLVTFLLSQPLFTQPGWEMRFVWDAFPMVAVLTALGLGYFGKDRASFYGLAIVLGAYAVAGFAHSGQSIGPIILQEEWEGLLELQRERPDIIFTRVAGGTAQWVSAAGFAIGQAPVAEEGRSFVLFCERAEEHPDRWLDGGCTMTFHGERHLIGGAVPIAQFGRFYVVPAWELPFAPAREETPVNGFGEDASPIINPG